MTLITGYDNFEAILILFAEGEQWEFVDGDERVGVDIVFNNQTYGPALLRIMEQEIADRGLNNDLALSYAVNSDALMGVEVTFADRAEQSIDAIVGRMLLRFAYVIGVVNSLPKNGKAIDLSVLYAAQFDELRRLEND